MTNWRLGAVPSVCVRTVAAVAVLLETIRSSQKGATAACGGLADSVSFALLVLAALNVIKPLVVTLIDVKFVPKKLNVNGSVRLTLELSEPLAKRLVPVVLMSVKSKGSEATV